LRFEISTFTIYHVPFTISNAVEKYLKSQISVSIFVLKHKSAVEIISNLCWYICATHKSCMFTMSKTQSWGTTTAQLGGQL